MVIKLDPAEPYLIGVISDTHGHLPSGVAKAFKKVDLIVHAGDIGDKRVLAKLEKIAPVLAVRGNMDYGNWASQLPATEIMKIGHMALAVTHIAHHLNENPVKAGYTAVISGHTHRPDVYEKNGITFINPGSASFPKFGHPGSAAVIHIKGADLSVEFIRLKG
jgi:putative phosphoesterase